MTELSKYASSVRTFLAERDGVEYKSCASLAEARTLADYSLIFEGDYGGRIFATCPTEWIKCDESTIHQLLADLDNIHWNDPDGCHVFFEYAPVGTRIGGGDGGGKIVNGVWCHEELIAINMQRAVADVIEGKTKRLAVPSLEKLEEDAGAGDANAQYYLAKRLRKDSPQASIEWFRKAGRQKILGAMHSLSLSRSLDKEERVRWMQALSELTLEDERIDRARVGLADALEKGDGVDQNLAAAAELYILLCDKKYSANCALKLAELYLNGQGVDSNRQLAAMWLILGTVPTRDLYPHWHRPARLPERERASELLSQIKLQMTPSEIAKIEEMASNFFR